MATRPATVIIPTVLTLMPSAAFDTVSPRAPAAEGVTLADEEAALDADAAGASVTIAA